MIIDAFLFCHELDLLEARLKALYDYVDLFVIQEGVTTHLGDDKPLFYELNKERFAWASDKIRHIVYDVKEKNNKDFDIERKQRFHLYERTREIAGENDIMFFSDVDEFISRPIIEKARSGNIQTPTILKQELFFYNLRTKYEKNWFGTVVLRKSDAIKDEYLLKTNRFYGDYIGGWHFSYFMSPEEMAYKMRSFAHGKAYGKGRFQNIENIKKHIENGTNLLDKPLKLVQNPCVPDYIIKAMPEQFR